MRSVDANPSWLVEKIRNMAAKREGQAATARTNIEAQQLRTAALSYRALADAVANKPLNEPDAEVPLSEIRPS